jgi:hypothetical protein
VQRRVHGRKLLIASIGVATLNYVGVSCGGNETSGNLAPPPPTDASRDVAAHDGPSDSQTIDDFPVANLAAMPDVSPADVLDDFPVANLVAMPDAGSE